jgi:hypothetical protein
MKFLLSFVTIIDGKKKKSQWSSHFPDFPEFPDFPKLTKYDYKIPKSSYYNPKIPEIPSFRSYHKPSYRHKTKSYTKTKTPKSSIQYVLPPPPPRCTCDADCMNLNDMDIMYICNQDTYYCQPEPEYSVPPGVHGAGYQGETSSTYTTNAPHHHTWITAPTTTTTVAAHINCGGHYATCCSECGTNPNWCNGECSWNYKVKVCEPSMGGYSVTHTIPKDAEYCAIGTNSMPQMVDTKGLIFDVQEGAVMVDVTSCESTNKFLNKAKLPEADIMIVDKDDDSIDASNILQAFITGDTITAKLNSDSAHFMVACGKGSSETPTYHTPDGRRIIKLGAQCTKKWQRM